MTDMLVKLYDLPDLAPALARCADANVTIRRAYAIESSVLQKWIAEHFSQGWVNECAASLMRLPVACFVAIEGDDTLLGFACYDVPGKGIFGPTGVHEAARGKGVGAALLLATLHDMRAQGYVYAVIGWTGPQEFYAKIVGATVIEDSRPGMYRGLIMPE